MCICQGKKYAHHIWPCVNSFWWVTSSPCRILGMLMRNESSQTPAGWQSLTILKVEGVKRKWTTSFWFFQAPCIKSLCQSKTSKKVFDHCAGKEGDPKTLIKSRYTWNSCKYNSRVKLALLTCLVPTLFLCSFILSAIAWKTRSNRRVFWKTRSRWRRGCRFLRLCGHSHKLGFNAERIEERTICPGLLHLIWALKKKTCTAVESRETHAKLYFLMKTGVGWTVHVIWLSDGEFYQNANKVFISLSYFFVCCKKKHYRNFLCVLLFYFKRKYKQFIVAFSYITLLTLDLIYTHL